MTALLVVASVATRSSALPLQLVLVAPSSVTPAGGGTEPLAGSFVVGLRGSCSPSWPPPSLDRPGDLVLHGFRLSGAGLEIQGGQLVWLCGFVAGDPPSVPSLTFSEVETLDPGDHQFRSRVRRLELDPNLPESVSLVADADNLESIALRLLLVEEVVASDIVIEGEIGVVVSELESRMVLARLHIVAIPEPRPVLLAALAIAFLTGRRGLQ